MMKWPLIFALTIGCNAAFAEPVWHCSRNKVDAEKLSSSEIQENQFSIASYNASSDVIGVSISDLIDIYSGVPIHIGGLPLSACFIPSNQNLTSAAITSLGLQPSVIQALAKKSAIIQRNLYLVTSEKQMLSCITQHFPSVGYLNEPINTTEVQPCF